MSGTFPSSPAPSQLRIRSLSPTLVSVAQSLKRQVRTRGGQRWGFNAVWALLTRADFEPMWAFLVAQGGQFGSFSFTPPQFATPQGGWPTSGTIAVDGGSQTGTTLNIKGLTASQSNIAKAGDFFKVAGTTKVYQVTADANSDSSGKAALSIFPKLVASPADGEALTVTAVPFNVALASDALEFGAQPPVLVAGFQLDLVEVY